MVQRPSSIRIVIASLLTVVACLLYLDRYAVGIASESMRVDLEMTQSQMSWFISAFFWSYALFQVPAGWLSDRFGPRITLTLYVLGWSLFTGLLGLTTQIGMVLLLRFLCGATQAGAYPVCSGMIREWFSPAQRGAGNSIVAMGGRLGAVLAPVLTAALITAFANGWRPVFVVYGYVGVLVALMFAWFGRNSPRDHPLCNEAERRLIAGDDSLINTPLTDAVKADEAASSETIRFPLIPILKSLSLWGNSLSQFLTNIGWLFVVTWLPRYLEKVHKIPLSEQAMMTTVPTIAGIVGMLCGGRWTDIAARRLGLKWGRSLPITVTRFTAAAGYFFCLILGMMYAPDPDSRWLPWMIILGLSIATFSCDLGVPSAWAYSQDVGGKYTASIMGWANMHGNFGAAIAPLLYNQILGETPTVNQWNMLFAFCAAVFALSGIAALVIDGSKQISNRRAD